MRSFFLSKRLWIFLWIFIPIFSVSSPVFSKSAGDTKKKEEPLKISKFPRKSLWIQGKPFKKGDFDEKATLIYFWDYTSVNCIRDLGAVKKWREIYNPYGLEVIWVHAPEFPFAGNREHVKRAVENFKIKGPVFLDNDFKMWDQLKVKSWPTKLLADETGTVVYSQIGEEKYSAFEDRIRLMLKTLNPGGILPERHFKGEAVDFTMESCGPMTSETYLGYKRASWWGGKVANTQWVPENKTMNFKDRGERPDKGFFVEGLWTNREDYLEHAQDTEGPVDYAGIAYAAHEVYALFSAEGKLKTPRVYVTRDELPVPLDKRGIDLKEDELGRTYVLYHEPRLYYLIANEDSEPHELKLLPLAKGLAVNLFSFSNACLSDFEHL